VREPCESAQRQTRERGYDGNDDDHGLRSLRTAQMNEWMNRPPSRGTRPVAEQRRHGRVCRRSVSQCRVTCTRSPRQRGQRRIGLAVAKAMYSARATMTARATSSGRRCRWWLARAREPRAVLLAALVVGVFRAAGDGLPVGSSEQGHGLSSSSSGNAGTSQVSGVAACSGCSARAVFSLVSACSGIGTVLTGPPPRSRSARNPSREPARSRGPS
jgi:hypothetical protein